MRLLSIGETEIRLSPLLVPVIPAAFILHREVFLLTAFISLCVHEAAHAMLASACSLTVDSIEIQPFGFTARLNGFGASRAELASVWASGPAASLALAAFNSLAERLFAPYAALSLGVTEFNLLTAAVNLLPALPLDGGRLLYAALGSGRGGFRFALFKAVGVTTGASFIALFVLLLTKGFINPTFGLMGAFMIPAALREREPERLPGMRPPRLRRRGSARVCGFAANGDMPLRDAIRLVPAGEYALITVLDEGMRASSSIDETRLMEAALTLGPEAKLRDAVAMYSGSML